MKKILVTGANGLLGQKLTYLLSNQKDTKTLVTGKGPCRFSLPKNIIYEVLDITNINSCLTIISKFQPDSIIHSAAITQVDTCENERVNCDRINVNGVSNLILAIGSSSIHFVHISSDFVYGGNLKEYFEDSEVHPLNYYGLSKWKSEQLFKGVRFPYTILRTVLVYGFTENLSSSNIVMWAKESLESRKKINVVDDQYRCPTLAEDLAYACWQVIQKKVLGVFHVSGSDFLSILEIVDKVADHWGLNKSLINQISTKSLNQHAKRPKKTKLNINKAKKEFNYYPRSFSEGLKLIDEQLQNKKN
jgi:dTDP-4-dehydrorhamnose reductase